MSPPIRYHRFSWIWGCNPYVVTRDMKRMQDSVRRLQPESRHVGAVEVEHVS